MGRRPAKIGPPHCPQPAIIPSVAIHYRYGKEAKCLSATPLNSNPGPSARLWPATPSCRASATAPCPLDRFKHFITQDYIYLIDFARCLALAAAKAPDLPTMSWFARAVDYILNTEMDLHRSYCAQFGITEAQLDATGHAPTCYSYTSYLLRVAHQGSFGELVAAVLPCIWGYWQVGQALADQGAPDHPGYAQWISMYAGPEQQAVAAECRAICDRVAASAGPVEIAAMQEAYITCTRYEQAFWEMGWTLEQWPV